MGIMRIPTMAVSYLSSENGASEKEKKCVEEAMKHTIARFGPKWNEFADKGKSQSSSKEKSRRI